MNRIFVAGLLAGLVLAACGGGGSGTAGSARSIVSNGTITGFGSVIVDGIEYETTEAEFEVGDDTNQTQDAFSVGQRVRVTGTVDDNGNHIALRVEYEAELHGIVTAVDITQGKFNALGQTIRTDASTIFSGIDALSALTVGDSVEVSGTRGADNAILASFVRKDDTPGSEVELRGIVTALNSESKIFSIGSQIIDYSNATLSPSGFVPTSGAAVKVKGSLQSGTLIATKIKADKDLHQQDKGSEARLEGFINSVAVDGSQFTVNSTIVNLNSSTKFEGGSSENLVVGNRVEVEGILQADGSLSAAKVGFELEHSSGAKGLIKGSVSNIDLNAQKITVLGVTLDIEQSTVFRDSRDKDKFFALSDLSVGDYVEVGFSESTVKFSALRIERQKARIEQQLQASVDAFDAATQTLTIAGVSVAASSATYGSSGQAITKDTFYSGLKTGDVVKVKGSFSNNVLTASEVELESEAIKVES